MTEVLYQEFVKKYCSLYANHSAPILFVGKNGNDFWLSEQLKQFVCKLTSIEPIEFIKQFFKEHEEQIISDLFKSRLENKTALAQYQIRSIHCRLLITPLNYSLNHFAGYQIELQQEPEQIQFDLSNTLAFPFRNPNPLLRLNHNGNLQSANPAAIKLFCNADNNLLPTLSNQLNDAGIFKSDKQTNTIFRIYENKKIYNANVSYDQDGISIFAIDITDILDLEEPKSINYEMLEALINEAYTAVVLIDKDYRILFSNQKATLKSQKYLNHFLKNGDFLPELVDSTFTENIKRAIRVVYEKGKTFSFDVELNSEDDNIIYFRFLINPIKDKQQNTDVVYIIVQDITPEILAEKELYETRNFYKTVLNNLPADIAVFDVDHNYLFINPVAIRNEEIRDWLIGKNDYDYFRMKGMNLEIADNRRAIFNEVVSTREIKDIIDQHHKPDGSTSYILRRFYPFIEDNSVKLVIGYGIDITPIKEAEKDTMSSLDKERELNKLKSHFVSLASHEFRTPLATIQSSMDILNLYLKKADTLSPDLENRFQIHHRRIEQEILLMTEIMNNILILGKMDANRMSFIPELMELNTLIQGLIDDRKSISLGEEVIEMELFGTPYLIDLDSRLMQHVMSNLLSNAVKYSKGNGEASVIMEYFDDKVIVRVKDTGIGIPANEIPLLFTSFFRASNTLNIQGTGLGLTIIKQVVEMHQGTVRVVSEIGLGTEFIVELPRYRVGV